MLKFKIRTTEKFTSRIQPVELFEVIMNPFLTRGLVRLDEENYKGRKTVLWCHQKSVQLTQMSQVNSKKEKEIH